MSPTDRSSFQHLANYPSVGLWLSAIEFLCPLFHDIHVGLLIGIYKKKNAFNNDLWESDRSQVSAIINIAPKIVFIYKCTIYIFHPKILESTICRDLALSNSYAPCSVIYMLHTTLPWYAFCTKHFRHLQFDPGSQNFQTIYHSLQSPLHFCPFQCTFVMILLSITQHTGSLIGINKKYTRVRPTAITFHT